MSTTRTMTANAVADEQRKNGTVEIIDVRTPVEFREVHAHPARNIPLDRLDPRSVMERDGGDASRSLYLICRSGSRSRQAAEKFEKAGFRDAVVIVEGGTEAWVAQGLPVVRGKKAVSLERQVRIAAGSLVFAGTALAFLVSPYFLALPAFIGAGLVFSGITDTCGMGMVLARMPWNQASSDCDAAACSS